MHRSLIGWVGLAAVSSVGLATLTARAAVIADSFTDGDHTANPAWTVNGGAWAVDAGVLEHTPTSDYPVSPPDTIQLSGFSETVPYTWEADAGVTNDNGWSAFGLTWRVQDADSMYAAYVFAGYGGGDKLYFAKFNNGTSSTSFVDPGFIPPVGAGQFSHLSVDVAGTNYTVTLTSGANTFSHTFSDATFSGGGGAGLIHFARDISEEGFFDNVLLTEVPEPGAAIFALAAGVGLVARRRRNH